MCNFRELKKKNWNVRRMQNKNAISFWHESRSRCEDEILTAKLEISRPIFSRNDEKLERRVRIDGRG